MYLKKAIWAAALLGLLVCGFVAYNIYSTIFSSNTRFNNNKAFIYIHTNATFAEVKKTLSPLLQDLTAFEAVAHRKGYSTNIKAGRYALTKGMSNNDIVNALRSRNLPVRVSFNNQETLFALAGRIAIQIEADSLSLLQAFNDPNFLEESGFNSDTQLGMYLPNTYEFFWNTSAVGFRDRMLKEYRAYWNTSRLEQAKSLNLNPSQVIALAAIVQKETAKVEERPRVASVYLNRLKKGMPLQADPTVIYTIKKTTNNYDTVIKRVLYRDLKIDSPYNTYKYGGIPPGPITMPDLSSIEAVLHPESHDYLYFVADTSNLGYHIFAKTLSQHNRNKRRYVRWLNTQNVFR